MEEYPCINAPCGGIRGKMICTGGRNYEAYLGIPYGKAERFCPPCPVSWEGMRDCLEYGSEALQPSRLGEAPADFTCHMRGSADCLFLNVWRPVGVTGGSIGLPVAVYVHGGAFQVGSGGVPSRSGDRFMEDAQMIFVSVNYRLGVTGFLQLGEEMGEKYRDSGNCGALDLVLALRWIRVNAAAFGGDPGQITLIGISAGAKLISSLLTIPEVAAGTSRVLLESGAMQSFRSLETARFIAQNYERVLGIRDERELLDRSDEELILAQFDYCNQPGSTNFFGPVLDDRTFRRNWKQEWDDGRGWKGAAMLGSGLHELFRDGVRPDREQVLPHLLGNLFGDAARISLTQYELLRAGGMDAAEAWVKVLSDQMYRFYTESLGRKLVGEGNPVWVYSFEYGRAEHGQGFSFMMGEQGMSCHGITPESMAEADALSERIRREVRAFICTGAPDPAGGWREFRNSVKMIFDAAPHIEVRREDTLEGFPEQVFCRSEPPRESRVL